VDEELTEPGKTSGGGMALIVGAGAAGAAACAALREFGYSGRIVLAGRDAPQPYDRTSLSKFVLSGDMKPDDVPPLLPEDFFLRHDIERVESDVDKLDVWQRHAVLANGDTLDFGTALICTGAKPEKPSIPGADLAGVHVLRSSADATGIVADLRPGAQAVILGTSFIGLEAASALRGRNIDVAVVGPDSVPFARQFGEDIGRAVRALHEANGVAFHTGTRAASLQGETHVASVVLENGETLPADIVLIAIGVKPVTGFVDGIERERDGGLKTDAAMRIAPAVFAAGDVAYFPLANLGGQIRIEHWRVAQQQARVAAQNMAGGSAVYDGVPFFWTYHYGKNIEYLGHAEQWDSIVIDGDAGQQDFLAVLCNAGRVAAVVACGREHATALLIEAMRQPLTAQDALALARAQQTANKAA
jgi:NADPH-dependent 2,4-dienoyl-CoA reductase/sulfur reductase-like enzyme